MSEGRGQGVGVVGRTKRKAGNIPKEIYRAIPPEGMAKAFSAVAASLVPISSIPYRPYGLSGVIFRCRSTAASRQNYETASEEGEAEKEKPHKCWKHSGAMFGSLINLRANLCRCLYATDTSSKAQAAIPSRGRLCSPLNTLLARWKSPLAACIGVLGVCLHV